MKRSDKHWPPCTSPGTRLRTTTADVVGQTLASLDLPRHPRTMTGEGLDDLDADWPSPAPLFLHGANFPISPPLSLFEPGSLIRDDGDMREDKAAEERAAADDAMGLTPGPGRGSAAVWPVTSSGAVGKSGTVAYSSTVVRSMRGEDAHKIPGLMGHCLLAEAVNEPSPASASCLAAIDSSMHLDSYRGASSAPLIRI